MYDEQGYGVQYQYTPDGDRIDVNKAKIVKQKAEIQVLKRELAEIGIKTVKDETLRKENPGLNDLWRQYQTMLILLK